MRPTITESAGFRTDTIDKVERLVELLSEVDGHPLLGDRLALHGGTAINVYHLPLPRLSVDADYTYYGEADVNRFQAERPHIEQAFIDLATALGYRITEDGKYEHAGRTLQLQYRGRLGDDQIKVDLTYMNRTPLLPIEPATCTLVNPASTIRTLALTEIVAGKLSAFFNRVEFRDLYDLHKLHEQGTLESAVQNLGTTLLRRVILWHLSVSDRFPFEVDGSRSDRFAEARLRMTDNLTPVINARDRGLTIRAMAESVDSLLEYCVRPKDQAEFDYLNLIGGECVHHPELLFAQWPEVLAQAQQNPIAKRKLQNLGKRPR